jgi:hypothetical protein
VTENPPTETLLSLLQERLGLSAAQRAMLAQAHAQLAEHLRAISAERLHLAATIKVRALYTSTGQLCAQNSQAAQLIHRHTHRHKTHVLSSMRMLACA